MPKYQRGAATLAASLLAAHASAHAIAGARIFPVTLTLDDPGVADEATLPELTYQRSGADGGPGPTQSIDSGFEYDKRITKDFGFAINDDVSFNDTEHDKTRIGWGDVVVTAKYQVFYKRPRTSSSSRSASSANSATPAPATRGRTNTATPPPPSISARASATSPTTRCAPSPSRANSPTRSRTRS